MSLDKNGLFEEKIMSLYRDTLDYLAETGFDIKGKVSNEWKMNMSPSNIEKLFDRLGEGAYDLSVPYKVGEDILSKTFMEVYGLEKEIDDYRSNKHAKIGRHEKALLRQYANLAYIAHENPGAQLDIQPPKIQ